MKRKHLNIILIILVLFIWGKLVYNYTKRFTVPIVNTKNNYHYKSTISVEKKDFKLSVLQRDPFLNKIHSQSKVKKRKPKTNKTSKPKYTSWPTITYLGFIKNKSAHNRLAILKVDGHIKNIKEQSYFNENIYIRKIFKDSIHLQINKQLKTIIK